MLQLPAGYYKHHGESRIQKTNNCCISYIHTTLSHLKMKTEETHVTLLKTFLHMQMCWKHVPAHSRSMLPAHSEKCKKNYKMCRKNCEKCRKDFKKCRKKWKSVGNIPAKSPYFWHVQEEFKASSYSSCTWASCAENILYFAWNSCTFRKYPAHSP